MIGGLCRLLLERAPRISVARIVRENLLEAGARLIEAIQGFQIVASHPEEIHQNHDEVLARRGHAHV
jgi:hypothetical protein